MLDDIIQQLEEFRQRLIDLTTRNNLLNANLGTKSQVLRFVDELPNQVFDFMLHESNTMYLDAVPEPSELEFYIDQGFITEEETLTEVEEKLDELTPEEREILEEKLAEFLNRTALEHANYLEINTAYELPFVVDDEQEDKHQDNRLQTILYNKDLDALASKIRRYSNSTLQEKGINSLYLSFGYLEWIDPTRPDKKNLAPLLSIPVGIFRETKKDVKLRRGSVDQSEEVARRLYFIEHSGEDVLTNEALKLKLSDRFGILPDYDSELSPEEYFSLVEHDIISQNTGWKIHRNISLSKLDFSKSVIYQDLDISKWNSGDLEGHSLIMQLFSERETKERVTDIELDKQPELDFKAPIVVDADSSQHSAIIDALKGKNMVIEGPPGTGKSQTIVNLIAALLHNNKKVLFVAEKAAALSVVKDRLSEIGLGNFCLDLQNKAASSKKQIINDLRNRLENEFPEPRRISQKRNELNFLRKELADYTNNINREYVNGLTGQEVLAKVVKLKLELELSNIPLKKLTDLKVDEADLDDHSHEINLNSYFESIRTIEDSSLTIENHPWNFITNSALTIIDREQIITNIEDLLVASKDLNKTLKKLTGSDDFESSITGLEDLLSIDRIGDYLGVEEFDYFTIAKLISEDKGGNYNKLIDESKGIITPSLKDSYYDDLNKSIENFNSEFEVDLNLVSESIQEIESFSADLDDYLSKFNAFFTSNIIDIKLSSKDDTNMAKPLEEILSLMPIEYEHLRDLKLLKNPTKIHKLLDELEVDLDQLDKLSKPLEGIFDLSNLPKSSDLQAIRKAFINKNVLSFLSLKWRRAKKQLMYFSLGQMDTKEEIVLNLANLIIYAKKAESISSNVNYQRNLGVSFSTVNTDIQGIRDLLKWYEEIQKINKKCEANLDSVIENIFIINATSIDDFNDTKFSEKAHNIETRLKTILANKTNISDDDFINNLLERKDEIIQQSKVIVEDQEKIISSIQLATLLLQDEGLNNNLLKVIFKSRELEWKAFDLNFDNTSKAIERITSNFNSLTELTGDMSLEQSDGPLKRLITLLTNALDQQDNFRPWLDYLRNRQTIINDESLNSSRLIAEEFENCSKDLILNLHNYRIYKNYADKIFRKRDIASFDEPKHKTTIKSFKDIDEKLIKLNGKMISARLSQNSIEPGINANIVKDKTDLALIDHLIRKPKARVSVRDLINRASDALISMNPCVMASPITVAQYFKKESNIFDVVIIDEASQIQPQDCISTIARCSQAVIVGDPKQMPPSTWMTASMDSESYETGDETDAEDAESILDLAINAFPVQRMLKWHYRSQHESLIAFSNSNWYGSNLVFFPAAVSESNDLGIQYTFVPDAVNNESNRNKEEALKVVEYVIEHMRTSIKKDSIGIVAMNRNQQIMIEDELEKQLDKIDDNNVTAYLESFEDRDTEKYFVKNLENVQGDERDVIVISFTYAPKELGSRLPQTFAQLYNDGWRRLNVLLTRAKKKMQVFSSFKFHQVNADSMHEGVVALRDFLEYAQTGKLPARLIHTGRDFDSDFEISVAKALTRRSYTCEPQIGVSSYRIDIGVHHPDYPGEFIMGVECDGYTYHSSKSARDRDRIRQTVLENLGWRIERIWSPIWFDNPNGEIDRIVKLIEKARDEDRKERKPYEEPEIVEDVTEDLTQDQMDEELADIIWAELNPDDTTQGSNDDQEEIGEIEHNEYEKEKEKEKEKEERVEDLDTKILALISESSGILARDIADELNVDKRDINILLYGDLKNKVWQDEKYYWHEGEEELEEELTLEEKPVIETISVEEKIENQLIELSKYVESDFPKTKKENRLLSDETIKIFTLHKPTTFEEFRTQVPLESRQQINGEEAQSYLWEVLEIIKSAA